MILPVYQKAIQAAKMADNYQLADPTLSRFDAVKKAIEVQKDMEE